MTYTLTQTARWLRRHKSGACARKFLDNCARRTTSYGSDRSHTDNLYRAFVWSETPEGLDYWDRVVKWAERKQKRKRRYS